MSISALSSSPGLPTRSLPTSVQPEPNERTSAPQPAPNEPAAQVSISTAGSRLARESETRAAQATEPGASGELTPDEEREVEDLRQRDREVRAHEAAHKAAAGSLSSGAASFSFTTGPDGRRYATSGEVSIDTSAVSGDPDATVRKLLQVRAAALAPASPSGQDRKVAAQASAQVQAARAEAAQEQLEESDGGSSSQGEREAAAPPSEAATNAESSHANHPGCAICGGDGHGPEIHYSRP